MSALTFYDRVLTNAATANTTGDATWSTSATQHAVPPTGIGVTVVYTLLDTNGTAWETGRAALAESGGTYTLTRGGAQTVTASSNSGSAVSFTNSSVHTLFLDADSDWKAKNIFPSSFYDDAPANSQVMLHLVAPEAMDFAAGLTGSQGYADTAATAQTDFDITKNGSSVGTMRFAAAGTVASFIMASATSFAVGDRLKVTAPATADATLAGVSFALFGAR